MVDMYELVIIIVETDNNEIGEEIIDAVDLATYH